MREHDRARGLAAERLDQRALGGLRARVDQHAVELPAADHPLPPHVPHVDRPHGRQLGLRVCGRVRAGIRRRSGSRSRRRWRSRPVTSPAIARPRPPWPVRRRSAAVLAPLVTAKMPTSRPSRGSRSSRARGRRARARPCTAGAAAGVLGRRDVRVERRGARQRLARRGRPPRRGDGADSATRRGAHARPPRRALAREREHDQDRDRDGADDQQRDLPAPAGHAPIAIALLNACTAITGSSDPVNQNSRQAATPKKASAGSISGG